MHDPMTVAFRVRRPWPQRRHEDPRCAGLPRFWPPILTVWHVDPESDGSDNSCGWGFARVPQAIGEVLKFDAREEARRPWLLAEARKTPQSAADAECLLRGAILYVAGVCRLHYSLERAAVLAARLLHNPVDNMRGSLGFLPGWHSNSSEDREADRQQCASCVFHALARILLTEARPWWRHPRWHFWHWRIEFHGFTAFDRPRSVGEQ